jgi:peptidoglycan/xylan/chitin deacetylase (PgdA/CDA1 family)
MLGASRLARSTGQLAGSAGFALAAVAAAQAGPAVAALGTFCPSLCPALAGRGLAGHVAVTFDDGPDPAATPRFLETLAARGVRATFFMLGAAVARAPGLAAEVAAAGHEIGVHGWTHRPLLRSGLRATRDDLARARDRVAEATGTVPWLFRPAYGILTGSALVSARALRLTPVLWTAWGREWRPGATTGMVLATLAAGLDGGGTVLLHDSDRYAPAGSWRAALGAVAPLLDQCARSGWQAGPLGQHGARWSRPDAA